jgi:hypothetical protein
MMLMIAEIEHAFHALALDERRKPFRPTLWYIPNELIKEGKPLPELKQVWFPGVHINSGGGSDDAIGDMKGDLERKSTLAIWMLFQLTSLPDLSMATFCWMLQCISPYLTIDQTAFHASMAQYERWLNRIRYNCTYHHDGWTDWLKSKIPNIPVINPAPTGLEEPKTDPAHTHPDFDYGWGTGPIVDSYTGIYRLAGELRRVPGQCRAELYDDKKEEYVLADINQFGETNEYIHPICHYRDIVRGPEPSSALIDFKRFYESNENGKGRFWWQKGTAKKLPEWAILEHEDNEVNFERTYYAKCEKTQEKMKVLKERGGYDKDFLATLDEKIDFGIKGKKGWEYP